MAAVNAGDDALIAKLLQNNHIQDLNFIVKFQSPLTKASRLGKYAIAEQLLCAGAGVEFLNMIWVGHPSWKLLIVVIQISATCY